MSERLIAKNLLPHLLISIGILILVASLGYGFYHYTLTNPGNAPLPDSLADLPLKSHAFGRQAVDQIHQLHGLEFPLSSGAVGFYGDQGQATLWISGTPSQSLAAKLTAQMMERIAEGNSPFTPTSAHQFDARTLYALEGHGQEHFYYQSGKLVVWLAADAEIADAALAKTLNFYP
jgi:hypothetical protein